MDEEEVDYMTSDRQFIMRHRSVELRRLEAELKAREKRLDQRERGLDRRQRLLELQLKEIRRTGRVSEPTGHSPLCSLSNEVIGQIVSYLDPPDLCELALTCRQLYYHASFNLYYSVRITESSALQAFRRNCVGATPLARDVKEFFLSLHLIEGARARIQRDVNIVNHLKNLKKLTLEYRAAEDMESNLGLDGIKLPLPSILASSLTECTIKFTDWARWSLHYARPLFEHPNIKRLSLHWVGTGHPHIQKDLKRGKGTTALEDLTFIDFNLSPSCLSQVLSYPRSLKKLAMHPSTSENTIFADEEIDCSEYFDELACKAATSLECLRMDMQLFGSVIVPAPGMDRLRAIRYLEVSQCHLNLINADSLEFYEVPDIECPTDELLPPNLEVLKISPETTDFPEIYEILKRKSELVPNLRRLVITAQYRSEADQLALAKREKERCDEAHIKKSMKQLLDRFPLVEKESFDNLQIACDDAEVDLLILYEDAVRRDVFDEGPGPPVWEIPQQTK